jgi:drug/metabolite transporter (DMT)-like permease
MSSPAAASPLPPRSLLGYALAAGGATMFASKGVLIKLAYADGLDALTLLTLRMAFSAPVFIAVAVWSARRASPAGWPAVDRRTVGLAVVAGLIGYWYSSFADFKALETLSPQFERLVLFTYPLFVVLIGAAFLGHRLRWQSVGAFAVSWSGLAVVFLTDYAAEGQAVLTGVLWVLSCAVTFAVYQLMAKPLIGRMGAPMFTAVAMTAATLGIFVHFALTHPLSALDVPRHALMVALAVAIFATVLPTYLMNMALGRISAAANSVIGTLSPVITMVLAALVLGEVITLSDVVGTILVLAGVGLFTVLDRRS